jgi:aminoglycoside phosphotransferase (APT) family kinase protein
MHSKVQVAMIDYRLEDFARTQVRAVLGSENTASRVEFLQAGREQSVLRLTLSRPPLRLVLKVAGPGKSPGVDFQRTATAMSLAQAAGVPVPTVLAVDTSYRSGPWSYLLQEHVDGVEWRRLRPQLAPEQVRAAHREIAAAVLAMQSVRFTSFGELNAAGQPAGDDLVAALRRRAQLRVADPSRRATFLDVLHRRASLFADQIRSTLCHDDLQHTNLIFRAGRAGWELAGVLDWDKAWAGPGESDIARMSFWDDMTGAGFWEVHEAAAPPAEGRSERALVYQLLWCLEYPVSTPRHRADTASVCRRLGVGI